MEKVYEQFFFMKYISNWTLLELYNLPIGLRNWFFKKLVDQKEAEKAHYDKKTKETSSSRY
jgi:hypothetical protein